MTKLLDNTIKDYLPLLNNCIKKYVESQRLDCITDINELRQVGMIAIYEALKLYNPDKGSLTNYLKRSIKNAIQKQRKFDTKSINNLPDDYLEYEICNTNINIDNKIDKEYAIKLLKQSKFSTKNKLLIIDRLNGYTVSELASKYNVSKDRVYKLLHSFSKILLLK